MDLHEQHTGTVAVQTAQLTAETRLTAWPLLAVEGDPAAVVLAGIAVDRGAGGLDPSAQASPRRWRLKQAGPGWG